MSRHSKTWWGQRFLEELEAYTDEGRLARGRSYSSDHRIKHWQIEDGKVEAKVRGNVNPYFGVYKEPTYKVSVQMAHLTEKQWQKVLQIITGRAGVIAKLLLDEIPENIETVFADAGAHLLPNSYDDFKVSCSCPDYAVPCKHIAGVCYRLAGLFDQDPFLLFEMRGLAPEQLRKELARSPLGQVLSEAKSVGDDALPLTDSFYARPVPLENLPESIDPKHFWRGPHPLPDQIDPAQPAAIPAMLIKKAGDYPGFWQKQKSFIEMMEDFYLRMRKNLGKRL
ncbi:MAG: SWIM zinc finger family protein [Gammaproteobacteria bacterium]